MSEYDFVIKKIHEGYVVFVRGREGHAHFHHRSACVRLIETICKHRMPNNEYFRTAARRILTDAEFESLVEHQKPMYINVNKGVVHK